MLLEEIDKYIDLNLDRLQNKELTVDLFFSSLFKDCKYKPLYTLIVERTHMLSTEKGIFLNSLAFLQIPLSSPYRLYPDMIVQGSGDKPLEQYKISRGLFLNEGTVYKSLEALNLSKSKQAFLYALMKLDEEHQDKNYMKLCEEKKLIDFETIFESEIKEKYNNKQIISL